MHAPLFSFIWIDIIVACVMARGIYTGFRSDIVSQFFKLLGVYFATIVAIHYYVPFAYFLSKHVLVPKEIDAVFAYGILATVTALIFFFMREGWQVILKVEGRPFLDKWGGLAFAVIKSYLICSLIFLGFILSGNKNLIARANHAYSGRVLRTTSAKVYYKFYSNVVHRYFPDEKINKHVFVMLIKSKKIK